MIKHLLLFAVTCIYCSICFAQNYGEYSIKTTLSKEECMDRLDEWVALSLGSYSLNVDYKNEKTGRTIMKGAFEDSNNRMYSVTKNAMSATIQYVIVTEAKDSVCKVTIKDLLYCFGGGGYVDYSTMHTKNIELVQSEIQAAEDLGGTIRITQSFLDEAEAITKEYDDISKLSRVESLKKSERKQYEKACDKMRGKRNVFMNISRDASEFALSILRSIEDALK